MLSTTELRFISPDFLTKWSLYFLLFGLFALQNLGSFHVSQSAEILLVQLDLNAEFVGL